MAVCEIHFNAQPALARMTSAMVILPEKAGPGPFPVFYLLHGLSDNHTGWTRRTNIERYVEGLPLIVVMPDGGRGWYSDSVTEPAGAFETFIVRDLIGFVDRTFQTKATREGRVIGGLSMGGYGAVKLALKYPEVFRAAASHSGALARPHEREPVYAGSEMHRVFGGNPGGGPNDIYALAERFADRAQSGSKSGKEAAGQRETTAKPALRIDCGTEDSLLDGNRTFHRHLENLGYAHEYEEHPGGHDWVYWDRQVQAAIRFFARALF